MDLRIIGTSIVVTHHCGREFYFETKSIFTEYNLIYINALIEHMELKIKAYTLCDFKGDSNEKH